MKAFIKIIKLLLLTMAIVASFVHVTYAQNEKEERQAAKKLLADSLINLQNFDFVARAVLPLRGVNRQLTSIYDITVSKDSVVSDLPYFGRAYSVPYNSIDGGFKFISTKFEYTKTPAKKDGWNIIIKPKDYTEVQQLSFRIFENGSASLSIISVNREPISFQGFIRGRKQRK